MRRIVACAWKDFKIFLKDPGALVMIFLQPLMFIVVMSYAMSGMFGQGESRIPVLAVNMDRGVEAEGILLQLDSMNVFRVETTRDGEPLTRERAERLIADGSRALALVFPPDFSEALEETMFGASLGTARILLIADPAASGLLVEPLTGMLRGLGERSAFFAAMPKGLDYLFDWLSPETPNERRQELKRRAREAISGGLPGGGEPLVAVERTTPPGMRVKRYPDVYQQNVPGYTIYGVFWIVSLLAGSVLQEKRDGTFRRLLVAPMNRAAMLAGKLAAYYFVNLIQLAIMLGVSSLLFGMSLGHSPAGLLLVSLTLAAAATGLGVLVSAFARTEAQVGGLTVLLLLTLSALGGCFVPRFVMPEWLRAVGLATPHAWALDAYQDLLVRGYGLPEVLPKAGVLALFAAVFFSVGAWRFRFE